MTSIDLGSAYGEIDINADGVRQGVDRANNALGVLQSFGVGVGIALGEAFLKAGVTIGKAIAGVVTASIGMAADLEEQMDNIASVMGASADEVKELQDLILELGINPNLKVSTLEAAAAIEMLGRNGLTTAEILAGAAEATVLLANATGAEFATAADIATDAMALFDIGAEDMTGAVDLIAGVVNASKFSIEDFQLALAQGGGVAATFGLTLEEFATVIAGISPSFASGSDAGTSFKTMLQRLTAPTDQAKALMNQLGIEVFDAEGNMKSMAEITGMLETALYGVSEATVEVGGRTNEQNAELARLQGIYDRTLLSIRDYEAGIKGASLSEEARAKKLEELRTVLANVTGEMDPLLAISGELTTVTKELTEEERAAALTMLFGSDAIRAAAALAELGIEGFENLAGVLADTSATDMAAMRMDNFKGVLEIVQGIIETIKIRIGSAFLPMLTRFGRGIAAFLEANGDRFVAFFEAAATFIETFIEALMNGEGPVGSFFDALAAAGVPQETIDRIREIVDAISDVIEKVVSFVTEHAEALRGALIGIGTVIAAAGIIAAIGAIAGVIASLANPITLLVGAAAFLGAAWAENWGGIRDKVGRIIEQIKEKIDFEQVFEDVKTALGQAKEFIITAFDEIKRVWFGFRETVRDVIRTVQRSIAAGMTPLETLAEVLSNFIPSDTMDKIRPFLEALQDFGRYLGVVAEKGDPLNNFLKDLPEAIRPLAQLFGEALAEVRNVILDIVPFFEEQFGKITFWFKKNEPLIREFLEGLGTTVAILAAAWAAAWAIAIREIARFWEVVKPIVSGLIDLLLGLVTFIMQVFTQDWEGAWQTVQDTAVKVWEAVKTAFVAFVDWVAAWFGSSFQNIVDTFKANWDQLVLIVSTVWDMIRTAIAEKVVEIIQGILDFFISINEAWNSFWGGIRDFVVGVWEGIKAAVMGAITGLFASMGLSFEEMKARWAAIWNDVLFVVSTVWQNIITAVGIFIANLVLAIITKVEEFKTAWGIAWDAVATKIGEIWGAIVKAVGEFLGNLFKSVGDKTGDIKTDLDTRWGEIKTAIGEIWSDIVTAVGEKLIEIGIVINTKMGEFIAAIGTFIEGFKTAGKNIVQGIIDGILSMTGALINTLTGLAEAALANFMAALGEESPSKEFFRAGSWAVQGFELGLIERLANALGVAFDAGRELVHGMTEGVAAGQTELEETLQELVDMANEAMDRVFGMVADSISAGSKFGSIANFFAKQLLDPTKEALDSIDEKMAAVADGIADHLGGFMPDLSHDLEGAIAEAEAIGDFQLADQLRSYLALQEERNQAEDEYIAAQERLLEIQEKQAQLAFLKNQLDLIKMLQEAGLNPAAVLEGITLGLNASSEDLLAASEAAMDALIAQADGQLGQAQDVTEAAVDAMTQGTESSLQGFIDLVAAMFAGAIDVVHGAAEAMYQAGQNVGNSLAAGIASAGAAVTAAVGALNQGGPALAVTTGLGPAGLNGFYSPAPAPAAASITTSPPQTASAQNGTPFPGRPGHTFNLHLYTDRSTADDVVSNYGMMKANLGA